MEPLFIGNRPFEGAPVTEQDVKRCLTRYLKAESKTPYGYRQLADVAQEILHDVLAEQRTQADTGTLEWELNEVGDILSELRRALTDPKEKNTDARWFWRHMPDPAYTLLAGERRYCDRHAVEVLTGRYLNQPFRSRHLDWLLLDVLIGMELSAFADQMLKKPKWWQLRPRFKDFNVVTAILFWVAVEAILLLGGAAIALWAAYAEIIPQGWGRGIALVLAGIYAFEFVTMVIRLPGGWLKQRKTRGKALELLEGMIGVYRGLVSGGPISAKHIYHRLNASAQQGTVWPAPAFVLLEDIIDRGGRIHSMW